MRNLTAGQKKLLRKWHSENYDGGYMYGLADKIDDALYDEIELLHPTEIHYQNVNNFLQELSVNWRDTRPAWATANNPF